MAWQALHQLPIGLREKTRPRLVVARRVVGTNPHVVRRRAGAHRRRHDRCVDVGCSCPRVVEALQQELHLRSLVRPVQFRKTHIIANEQPALDAVDHNRGQVVATRVVAQIAARAETLVVALSDPPPGVDCIQAIVRQVWA